MDIHSLIDAQIDRGTASNQVLQWNNTTKRFEVTLTPSGLTSIGTGSLTASGTIQGGTLTDGTLSINSGSITSAVNGTFSGTVQAEQITSTDNITMLGDTLTIGDGSEGEVEIEFNAGAETGTLSFDDTGLFELSNDVFFNGGIEVDELAQFNDGVDITGDSDLLGDLDIAGKLSALFPDSHFLVRDTSVTNAVRQSLEVVHNTSGNMVDGFGAGIRFKIGDPGAPSPYSAVGRISVRRNGADNTGEYCVEVANAGSLNLVQCIDNIGEGFWKGKLRIGSTVAPVNVLDVTGAATIGDGGTTNYTQISATGVQTFHGLSRIDWTKITANGVTLGDGPPTSPSSVSDLQTANDGNEYHVDEASSNAGQNLIVDFTDVTAFNWVQILMHYDGQTSHELQIQLEVDPFDDSTWHTFDECTPEGAFMESHSFFVPDSDIYINSGVVKVRFLHPGNGNSTDDWLFDVVALYQ